MAFSSYYKTETDPTIYGIAEEGQRVAFQNPEQFYQSGGAQDFSNVTTDATFNPAGAINYTDYLAKSQPTTQLQTSQPVQAPTSMPLNTPTSMPATQTTAPTTTQTTDISKIIGTRPSTVDPNVTEYFNAQTGVGFANPEQLSTYINQLTGSTAINPQNVFDYLNSPTGKQALLQAQATGPAPQDAGEARAAVSKFTPPTTNTAGIEQQLAADPGYQNFLKLQQEYNDIAIQSKSLVDTYKQLMQESGIQGINADLLNMKKVIEGTEDDIRKEVQATSGLATESQVIALAGARNKQLTKNYNNLLAQKEMAQQTVNTMIGLSAQDRQFALQNILQKFNIEGQIQEYRQKFINNAQEGYNRIIEAVGYQGLYNMLSQDPSALAMVEKSLGLNPGGLQSLSIQIQQQQNLAAIKAAGITTRYANVGGEIQDTKTGYAFHTPEEFFKAAGISSWDQAKGLITGMTGSAIKGATTDISEYNFAKSQGYKGTFMDWQKQMANLKLKSDTGDKIKFTDTQLAKGASNAGMSIEEFKKLDSATQNSYIFGELVPMNTTELNAYKKEIDGFFEQEIGLEQIREAIDSENMSQPDKETLKAYAESVAPKEGFWSGLLKKLNPFD